MTSAAERVYLDELKWNTSATKGAVRAGVRDFRSGWIRKEDAITQPIIHASTTALSTSKEYFTFDKWQDKSGVQKATTVVSAPLVGAGKKLVDAANTPFFEKPNYPRRPQRGETDPKKLDEYNLDFAYEMKKCRKVEEARRREWLSYGLAFTLGAVTMGFPAGILIMAGGNGFLNDFIAGFKEGYNEDPARKILNERQLHFEDAQARWQQANPDSKLDKKEKKAIIDEQIIHEVFEDKTVFKAFNSLLKGSSAEETIPPIIENIRSFSDKTFGKDGSVAKAYKLQTGETASPEMLYVAASTSGTHLNKIIKKYRDKEFRSNGILTTNKGQFDLKDGQEFQSFSEAYLPDVCRVVEQGVAEGKDQTKFGMIKNMFEISGMKEEDFLSLVQGAYKLDEVPSMNGLEDITNSDDTEDDVALKSVASKLLEYVEQKIFRMEEKINQLNDKLNTLQGQKDGIEQKIDNVDERIKHNLEDIRQCNIKIHSTETQLSQNDATVIGLDIQISETNDIIDEIEERVKSSEAEINIVEDKKLALINEDTDVSDLNEAQLEYEETLNEQRVKLSDAEKSLQDYVNEKKAIVDSDVSLKEGLVQIENDKNLLDQDNLRLVKDKNYLGETLDAVVNELKAVEGEIEGFKEQHQALKVQQKKLTIAHESIAQHIENQAARKDNPFGVDVASVAGGLGGVTSGSEDVNIPNKNSERGKIGR